MVENLHDYLSRLLEDEKITMFGGNKQGLNVHVADTIIKVLESPLEIVGGEIFNVGSEENNYTINQLGTLIKEVISNAEIVIEEKKVDKRDYGVNFSKLSKTLNLRLKRSVLDSIKEIKEVLERNPSLDYTDKKYNNIKLLENNRKKIQLFKII